MSAERRRRCAPRPRGATIGSTLATIALGAGVALLGVHAPIALVTGVALGLAGVLLAVRGDRPVPSPRLMTARARARRHRPSSPSALLGLYEEWIVGQRLVRRRTRRST